MTEVWRNAIAIARSNRRDRGEINTSPCRSMLGVRGWMWLAKYLFSRALGSPPVTTYTPPGGGVEAAPNRLILVAKLG